MANGTKKGAHNTYLGSIMEGLSTSWQGLKLSLKHLKNATYSHEAIGVENAHYFEKKTGIVTLQYPFESIPVPDNGRYQLHNEMDDCIVCDKCVKICPVNCIDIEPIKSTEEIGRTSDGTVKRLYAAKFDIDMAKCCFCGLCTTVCPTECLTMTPDYDFSTFSVQDMNFKFATLSAEEADEKRRLYETQQAAKAAEKSKTAAPEVIPAPENETVKKPFKPVFKNKTEITTEENATPEVSNESTDNQATPSEVKKPFKPIIKKKAEITEENTTQEVNKDSTDNQATPSEVKKPFKPIIKKKIEITEENATPKVKEESTDNQANTQEVKKPFKPIMRKKTDE